MEQAYETNSISGRIVYIDMAKGFGMVLVVIGHCINGYTFPATWIGSFHMPLFFILSVICFKDEKYPTFLPFLEKRIKTLFLPCIYFSVLLTAFSMFLFDNYDIKELCHGLPGALWFVLVLFFCELIYYFINRISDKFLKCVVLFSFLFIGIMLDRWHVALPYSICTIFAAVFFYGLGHNLKSFTDSLIAGKILSHSMLIICGVILLLLPGIVVIFTGESIGMSNNIFPYPALLYCLLAVMGTYGTIIVSTFNYFQKLKKMILFIGNNTLTILSVHMFFISLSSLYIHPIIHYNHLLYKIVEQVVLWIAIVLTCSLVNKKARWIIGKS